MSHPAFHDAGGHAPQPLVLIGHEGMLGWAWYNLLETSACRWSVASRPEVDLSDHDSLRAIFAHRPRVVINCAAWTDVDGAESHEEEAAAVNATALSWLGELCARHGTVLVNYSTDYVFDGGAASPYSTDHPRAPVGAYGRTKAAGEEAIERSGCEFLNIRTSWLYAPWGKNFVRTIAGLLREKPAIRVVDDQRGRPTSAEHLAAASLGLLAAGARGHWHVTDGGECTWCEFAREIGRLTGAPGEVQACTTAEYPRPARRPAYSVLDLSRTEARLGPMPDWRKNLAGVVERLES